MTHLQTPILPFDWPVFPGHEDEQDLTFHACLDCLPWYIEIITDHPQWDLVIRGGMHTTARPCFLSSLCGTTVLCDVAQAVGKPVDMAYDDCVANSTEGRNHDTRRGVENS